jgi:ubiquinone/menaquinone biosynthesis C-methylase UbiE
MTPSDYVHGYAERETARLVDQANTLVELLHFDTVYPDGTLVLEAGCGIGAQTVTLARNSPGAQIHSVDIAAESLALAQKRLAAAKLTNVEFAQADVFNLPLATETYDHVFVCFVLEHLPRPAEALARLKAMIKTGGSISVIEGDHGSAYFHPDSAAAQRTIQCLVELQARAGGNALIGRELYPLLVNAGFRDVRVSPRMVYADANRPDLVEGFTKKTFTAMVEGVRQRALEAGLIDEPTWKQGIADLYRSAEQDGTFCYTFFKAVAVK